MTATNKGQELMTKADVQQFTKYVVAETKNAIMKTTGTAIGGMSHDEAEMWAKTTVAAKLYPQKDKSLTPSELVSRALVKGVAGSKFGLDFFESQRMFHILHDGSMGPHYKLRIAQMNGSPKYRFRYEDDGETCTGIVSELIDGKWVDKTPITFSMADAEKAGLLERWPDKGKEKGAIKREPWEKWPDRMRLARVSHRCYDDLCAEIHNRADTTLLNDDYRGDDADVSDADPFAVDEIESVEMEMLPPIGADQGHSGEGFQLAEPPEAPTEREPTPHENFLELARVKFEGDDGELDVESYDNFLERRRPEFMSADEIAELTAELRTV